MKYLNILKCLAELKMHQKKSKRELEGIQFKRLKSLVNHIYDHVLFYRILFDNNNIEPDDIKKLEDINKIPITTKREIQANYDSIISNTFDRNKLNLVNTTGSTGIPLPVLSDKKSINYSSALYYFAFFEAGLRLTDKTLELATIMEDEPHILRKKMVSVYNPPEKVIGTLKEYNPDMIYSFPSIFKTLSYSIKEKLSLGTRMICTHGETLTDSNRKAISSIFNAEVYNTYGSTEFNRLAFECGEHSGLHMITDCAIIELNKDGQSVDVGEEGEIIVTGLYNYAMPLIRYKLGDIGIFADYECPCGRGWPLLKSIEGRSDDFLTLPSGRIISPRTINVIENIPGIIQYRTVQKKRDTFLIQVIPGKEFSDKTKQQIEEQIRMGCSGEKINIDIELIDDIPRERTGKLKTIISEIK